jgi:diguanylate cyclase (GGDEF)-like protein
VCLGQAESELPWLALVLAPLLNGLLVVATASRRHQSPLMPTFDYGGIATVAILAAFGPAPALCAFLGETVASAFLPDASGSRPSWIRSVYNMAWGSPCMVFSWSLRGLAPDRTLEPAVVAAAWWLSNGVLVGTMAALAQKRSLRDGLRLGLTEEGWMRLQEAAISVLAVVALWTNPLLLAAVVLLVVGQAMTGRRLFHGYEATAVAREQARRDPLTLLANRRAFEEALDSWPSASGVLMLDLDHFKRINDTFGHHRGDRVLVELAMLVQEALGAKALCARLGGEEFCALIADVTSDDELLAIAEGVRLAVKGLRFDDQPDLSVTISIGAARASAGAMSVRDAILRADRSLYLAKRRGRDRTELDAPDALAAA